MIQFLPLLMQALGSGAGGAVAAGAKPAIGGQLFDAIKAGGGPGYGSIGGGSGGPPPWQPQPMPAPPGGGSSGSKLADKGGPGSGAGHKKAGTLGASVPESYKDMSQMMSPTQIPNMMSQLQGLSNNAQQMQQQRKPTQMEMSPYMQQLMRML